MTTARRRKNHATNGANGSRATAASTAPFARPDPHTFFVKHALVYFHADAHVRSSRIHVAKLAQTIARSEQLAPVLVERGGPAGFLFTVVDGARQHAAFAHLERTDCEILVRVIPSHADPVARLATYWMINTAREPLSLLDQARVVHALVSGTYATRPGERARSHEIEDVSRLLGVSRLRVRRLLRVHRRLHPDVVQAVYSARANGLLVPASLLHAMTERTDDGDSDDARLETQTKIFTEWTDKKLALKSKTTTPREVRR